MIMSDSQNEIENSGKADRQHWDILLGLTQLAVVQEDNLRRVGETVIDKDMICRYGLALQIEVSEFLNELPWKSWKPKQPWDLTAEDRHLIGHEFADILAFLGTWMAILNALGISVEDLTEAYTEKTAINHARFQGKVEGYSV